MTKTDAIATDVIAGALRTLAQLLDSDDGVVGAALYQAAARLEEQAEEIQRLQAEVEALRQFVNEIISGTLAGGSFDGGDIQEMAVQHGLLRSEQRDEACGDVCNCSEFGFPCECFRKTALLLPDSPERDEK